MCNNPKFFNNIHEYGTGKLYPVPCHCCLGCRIDRRLLWEYRCTSEFVKYRSAFVTLTYDEYHLPFNKGSRLPTIRHSDFHKFIDRLRHYVNSIPEMPKACTKDFKFVACSEYGTNKFRPHFHVLFFGLDWLYFKKIFIEKWQNGIVDVGPILSGGIRYILKYMDSQLLGEYALNKYFDVGVDIPKMYFSRGIGKDFFISQIENINEYGCAKIGNRLIPIPSYWKNKLFHYCDKNIYARKKHYNNFVRQMDSQFRSLGFDSYEDYLRYSRKALEMSYERKNMQKHIPNSFVSRDISDRRLNPATRINLDYSR